VAIIISKLGHTEQNSYVTILQANNYFSRRRDVTEWEALQPDEREEALIQAARDLDSFDYTGDKYYRSQGLAFPRRDHRYVISGNCGTPITINSFRHSSLFSSTYGRYPTSYWKYGTVHITNGTPQYDVVNIASSNVTNGSITTAEDFSAIPNTNTSFRIFAPIDRKIQWAQYEQALYLIKNKDIKTIQNMKELGVKRVEIGRARMDFTDGAMGRITIAPQARKLISRWLRKHVSIGRG
jgi:hypothetical protein